MLNNAHELSEAKKDDRDENCVLDTDVLVYGTWQKRGYASLNGVITTISVENGKVLNCEPTIRKNKENMSQKAPRESNVPVYGQRWFH